VAKASFVFDSALSQLKQTAIDASSYLSIAVAFKQPGNENSIEIALASLIRLQIHYLNGADLKSAPARVVCCRTPYVLIFPANISMNSSFVPQQPPNILKSKCCCK